MYSRRFQAQFNCTYLFSTPSKSSSENSVRDSRATWIEHLSEQQQLVARYLFQELSQQVQCVQKQQESNSNACGSRGECVWQQRRMRVAAEVHTARDTLTVTPHRNSRALSSTKSPDKPVAQNNLTRCGPYFCPQTATAAAARSAMHDAAARSWLAPLSTIFSWIVASINSSFASLALSRAFSNSA